MSEPMVLPRWCGRCGESHVARCPKAVKSYREATDRRRESAAKRGYGRRWQETARAFLAKHTECVECRRHGRLAVSEVVDHVIPHRGDMQIFWRRSNWQALCKSCHDSKTARGE